VGKDVFFPKKLKFSQNAKMRSSIYELIGKRDDHSIAKHEEEEEEEASITRAF